MPGTLQIVSEAITPAGLNSGRACVGLMMPMAIPSQWQLDGGGMHHGSVASDARFTCRTRKDPRLCRVHRPCWPQAGLVCRCRSWDCCLTSVHPCLPHTPKPAEVVPTVSRLLRMLDHPLLEGLTQPTEELLTQCYPL